MGQFPGAYSRCTIVVNGSGCLNWDRSLECLGFVNNYNVLIARQDLAPLNAEEPIRTAAAIYTVTVQEFIEILTPQVAICREQMGLGRTDIDSGEIAEKNIPEQLALISQMDQVINIMRQVEESSGVSIFLIWLWCCRH